MADETRDTMDGIEPEALEWFVRDAAQEATPVDHEKERVPEGTRWAGDLWVTPRGEFVLTGHPQTEEHDCDMMGCSSVSHVIARITPTEEDDHGD